jgi:hypothetical protein
MIASFQLKDGLAMQELARPNESSFSWGKDALR